MGKPKVILRCTGCGYKTDPITRPYGIYTKPLDICPKCGAPMKQITIIKKG